MNKQKKIVLDYFDARASDWSESVYNDKNRYLRFPTSLIRDSIVLREIDKDPKQRSFVDVGCGSGEMAMALLDRNHSVYAVDNAPKMIEQARVNLKEKDYKQNPEKTFVIADLEELDESVKYDGLTATGVIEYIVSDEDFLKKVSGLLKSGGYAYISCRNGFFNASAANEYTKREMQTGNLDNLIEDMKTAEKYSPISALDSLDIQEKVYSDIYTFFSKERGDYVDRSGSVKSFPVDMDRRFHTPNELDRIGNKYDLSVSHVIYFHFHPYPPKFQKSFPYEYNQIALRMQPLGDTPLGMNSCSGFLAVMKKS